MTLEETRLHHRTAKEKVRELRRAIANAIDGRKDRIVEANIKEFHVRRQEFEKLHSQLILKLKVDPGDPSVAPNYVEVQSDANKVLELTEVFRAAVEKEANLVKKTTIVQKFKADFEGIGKTLIEFEKDTDGLDSDALAAEFDFIETEFYRARAEFNTVFDLGLTAEETAANTAIRADAERGIRRHLLGLRSKHLAPSRLPTPTPPAAPSIAPALPVSSAPSLSGASSASSDPPAIPGPSRQEPQPVLVEHHQPQSAPPPPAPQPRVNQTGQNVDLPVRFKTKRLDFPVFDGTLRQYITFKRDFQEIVENPGGFNQAEMCQILRNQCLQGASRELVASVYNYQELWAKLDEVYLDEQRLIDQVTDEIMDTKIGDQDDYDGFIRFADKIERAYHDLVAMGNHGVMNHPVTVSLILKKCPDWVRKSAASMLAAAGDTEREFDIVLNLLTSKRKEARRLQRWIGSDTKKKPQPAPSNTQRHQKPAASGRALVAVEHGAAPSGPAKKPDKDFKCIVKDCTYRRRHGLSECRAFKKLEADAKAQLVVSRKACKLCLSASHVVDDCPRKATWRPCDIDQCGAWHSRLLHGTKHNGVTLATTAAKIATLDDGTQQTVFLVQKVNTRQGGAAWTVWDTASSDCLVTFDYARRAKLTGIDCVLDLGGVGDHHQVTDTQLYSIDLVKNDGTIAKIFAYGVKCITANLPATHSHLATENFPDCAHLVENRPECTIDLLIGLSESHLHPIRVASKDKLSLYKSEFGTGMLIGGSPLTPHRDLSTNSSLTLFIRSPTSRTIVAICKYQQL